jgi:putative membrane protein
MNANQPTDNLAAPLTPKTALGAIGAVSAVACLALLALVYVKPHAQTPPAWSELLPWFNAAMNALSATFLVLGVVAIRKRELDRHRQMLLRAFAASTGFLFSYVTYHWVHGDSKYQGPARSVYLAILISHIVLSVPTLPMVLTTFFLSLTGRIQSHRKLAKITFPLWLYVSVTGVVVVLMLKLLSHSA